MNPAEEFYRSLVQSAVAEVERRVLEKIQSQAVPDRVMNSQEAAEYLNVSRKTLYTMCREKQIKHIPAGSARSTKPVFLFRQSTLDAWLVAKEEASCKEAKTS